MSAALIASSAVDVPTIDAPTVIAPTMDIPPADTPTMNAPTVDIPPADTHTVNAPTMDVPITETPTADAPTVEAPTTDAPTADAPTEDASTVNPPCVEPPAVDYNRREAACDVLRAQHIAYTHWYEDAVSYHGSKTCVFSLYLLVNSVPEAERCLQSHGWVHRKLPEYAPQFHDPAVDEHVVLGHPQNSEVEVVLMLSHPWPGITPSTDDCNKAHYPPLPQLYNALVQRLLDTECDPFGWYLILQVAYLYEDCPALASSDFLTTLSPDIQQFHLDWLSKTLRMDTKTTLRHEREIRARARQGHWELMHEGTADLGGYKVDRDIGFRHQVAT
ncbi:hypothetical protein GY45DRAFT_1323954 [Cubamyces sp. BRFM 1775]|nr:hypothetical protein GY45DRAFT_1323954 [Cubamyces sp. BRFM 1775]